MDSDKSPTFNALCIRMKCTPTERDKLAWHLAMMRARAVYTLLRPSPMWPIDRPTPQEPQP